MASEPAILETANGVVEHGLGGEITGTRGDVEPEFVAVLDFSQTLPDTDAGSASVDDMADEFFDAFAARFVAKEDDGNVDFDGGEEEFRFTRDPML